jgi:hypothetical protein
VPCQTGPSPYFLILTSVIFFWTKYWQVVATDRALVVLRAGVMGKPKEVAQRLPRGATFGPLTGLWAQTQLLGTPAYVHKRFHKDAAEADALAPAGGGWAPPVDEVSAAAPAATPAGWYPDATDPSIQRYWDGTAWTEHTSPTGWSFVSAFQYVSCSERDMAPYRRRATNRDGEPAAGVAVRARPGPPPVSASGPPSVGAFTSRES